MSRFGIFNILDRGVEGRYATVLRSVTSSQGPLVRQNDDVDTLPAPVPVLLQSQAYVVDLTEAYDDLAALIAGSVESAPNVRKIGKEHRQLRFTLVATEATADLLMDQTELRKITGLL